MGIKSIISLQMIPWCFPLIWNHISCVHLRPDQQPTVSSSSGTTIKLIKSDGIVKIYHQPITASDLMTEFPKHLICHSDSFYIGQKIQALSETDKLQLGQKYFLLPNHFFQSVLSFVTIASFAAAQSSPSPSPSSSSSRIISNCSNKNDFIKKVATCQPFDIQKTASGSLQIRVSDEFISKLMESGKIKDEQENRVLVSSTSTGGSAKSTMVGKVCTTPELEKDYSQLVGYVKQWKPKLETITESERRRRRFGSFAGIRRIRNYNKKKSQIQPKGYSESGSESGLSSSPYNNNQMIKIKKSSSDEQYQLHHHQQQNVTIIKTKGRKICKF